MSTPRLEIDLDKLYHNARHLITRLSSCGITVTAVTKAFLGAPDIANTMLRAGIRNLADSRIENIERMRTAGIGTHMSLIRSPMISQVDRVVNSADISFNTELNVIKHLSTAARKAKKIHGIILMIELGDLREGILPKHLGSTVHDILRLPSIALKGLGTNLACRNGVMPDDSNMTELTRLADAIDEQYGTTLEVVSGGNSGNLKWAFSGKDTGRINDLRIGEALLLGCEPLHRETIDGLYTDAFTLVAEVIESKIKPSQPWGQLAQNAFGETHTPGGDKNEIAQTILALGRQDTDLNGLRAPPDVKILGGSSDHLIIDAGRCLPIGSKIRFQPNYSALVRAMTSPFVTKQINPQTGFSDLADVTAARH